MSSTPHTLANSFGSHQLHTQTFALWAGETVTFSAGAMPITKLELASAPAGAELDGNLLIVATEPGNYRLRASFQDSITHDFMLRSFEPACRFIGPLTHVRDDVRARQILQQVIVSSASTATGRAADLVGTYWAPCCTADEHRAHTAGRAQTDGTNRPVPGSLKDAEAQVAKVQAAQAQAER